MENNLNNLVNICGDTLIINAHLSINKDFTVKNKEVILDILSNHYQNQNIIIHTFDGENLKFSGFLDFVYYIQTIFNIDNEKISWITQDPTPSLNYPHKNALLTIFKSTGSHIEEIVDKDLSDSKFVGALLSRASLTRFRLAYEIDKTFPDDNYTIFHPNMSVVQQLIAHVELHYTKELNWFSNKKFDTDIKNINSAYPTTNWKQSCQTYNKLWNKFQIEIISETDPIGNFWFTEKTARCLATGKPFVLVSGTHSLKKLQDMGFYTFNEIIDETYDNCLTTTTRIYSIMESLKKLYNAPDKDIKINNMYQIAQENIAKYQRKKYDFN